ncbi:MAG: hypothetical protein C0401_01620 [Anaerolinea sp.]|nr:hypothetical protein [Anaerolinea sp.]
MKDEPEVLEQTYQLYLKSNYAEAYDLLMEAGDRYPAWTGRFYEIRVDLAAVMGKLELAEEILAKALDEGYFYNEFVLRKDDDLKFLQGRPRFETLVERSFKMLADAQAEARPETMIIEHQSPVQGNTPFFMGLHGNNSHAEGFSGYWGYLTAHQWLVALPQSSQVSAKGLYVWNDMEMVERELTAHYHTLQSSYPLDPAKTVIGGFSKGGHAAIHSVLRGLFPICGFIAMVPYVGDLSTILPLLGTPGQEKLRGYFLLGEKDEHCTPGAVKLEKILGEHGIQCGLEIFPNMAHDIPENFDPVLQRAVEFILND